MNVLDFKIMKDKGEKISMLTCYDFWTARILDATHVDCLLVGDSAAMVMHGHDTTVRATTDLMVAHARAVVQGAKSKFIVADMPFLSFRKGVNEALDAAGRLIQAGAHAVKLEGVRGHEETVRHLVESGIPVMGHIGLTPQSIHQLGGFKVQGKTDAKADELRADALQLQKLGCFAVVLECVPTGLAKTITDSLAIPTIGIGAGVHVDGQVLVLHDMLGANSSFSPKFLRRFANLEQIITSAVEEFDEEVKGRDFPTPQESYL